MKNRIEDVVERMMQLQDQGKQFLNDSPFINHGSLLRAGVISLLLHVVLITLLAFNLKPFHTKGESTVYRVTLKTVTIRGDSSHSATPMLIPAKAHIKKEYPHAKTHLSDQTVTRKIPVGEKDQTSGSQKEEETPIPLPIGDLSPSDMDSNIKMENNPPAFLSLVRPGEPDQNIIPGLAAGGGSGQEGSANGGSGEGSGTGGQRSGDIGGGEGPGQRGFGRRGSGKGAGIGQEGSGWGGSGNGGSGGPHPRYAKNPRPAYPQEARERGYQGVVLLKAEVLSNGIVGQLKVIKSSGYAVLDQCALAAVQKWRFIPARKEMIAIPCWVNIPIKFELQ